MSAPFEIRPLYPVVMPDEEPETDYLADDVARILPFDEALARRAKPDNTRSADDKFVINTNLSVLDYNTVLALTVEEMGLGEPMFYVRDCDEEVGRASIYFREDQEISRAGTRNILNEHIAFKSGAPWVGLFSNSVRLNRGLIMNDDPSARHWLVQIAPEAFDFTSVLEGGEPEFDDEMYAKARYMAACSSITEKLIEESKQMRLPGLLALYRERNHNPQIDVDRNRLESRKLYNVLRSLGVKPLTEGIYGIAAEQIRHMMSFTPKEVEQRLAMVGILWQAEKRKRFPHLYQQ